MFGSSGRSSAEGPPQWFVYAVFAFAAATFCAAMVVIVTVLVP